MWRFFFTGSLFALLYLAAPLSVSAATIATTTISTDTHWTTAGSPYLIPSPLTIASAATLTIDPGVVVKVFANPSNHTAIDVFGRLIAGDPSSSSEVVFTSVADDTFGGDTNGDGASTTPEQNRWGAIMFENATNATSTLSHVRFRYSGVTGNTKSTTLSMQGGYVYIKGDRVLVGARVEIADSVFEAVPGYQIYQGAQSYLDLERDEFQGQIYLIRYASFDPLPTTFIMHGSSVHNVSAVPIDYKAGTFISSLTNNWWGDASGPFDSVNNPKGKVNLGFTVNVVAVPFLTCDPAQDVSCLPAEPVVDPCATPGACVDNVLFLPGIEGSRLYEGASCTGTGEEKEWEPSLLGGNDNVRALLFDSSGTSICQDVYTKEGDIISSVAGTDYYTSFGTALDALKTAGTMNDWKPVAYDWRLSLDELLANGTQTGDHISYLAASSTPYIEQTLRALAATSKTGKVTIIAHSNGGLVAKALMQKLGDTEASALVDRIILVGVPQSGAPAALGGLLFGYGQGIPFDFFDKIVSRATARLLALTMPMAYHLLPSKEYLESTAANPIIHFFGSAYATAAAAYGSFIASLPSFDNYLLATGSDRTAPADDNIFNPAIANNGLLDYANTTHATLDAWVPPSDIQVDQIAGWGDDNTLAGINFRSLLSVAEYEPTFTEDGDGTVPVPSALLMPESPNVKRYWMNLAGSGFSHANLFGNSQLISFINSVLSTTTPTLPGIFSTTAFTSTSDKKLTFYLHSPLTLGIYDASGNYTGAKEDGSTEEGIPSTSYGTFGSVQYIIAPAGSEYRLAMQGLATGTFSLSINESTGGVVSASSTVTNVPSTASTTVGMTFTDLASEPELSVDENGDTANVFTVGLKLNDTVFYTAPVVATTSATTTDSSTPADDASDTSSDSSSSSGSSSGSDSNSSGVTVYAALPAGSVPAAPVSTSVPASAPVSAVVAAGAEPVVAAPVVASAAQTKALTPQASTQPAVAEVVPSAPEETAQSPVGVIPVETVSDVPAPVIESAPPAPDLSQAASVIGAVGQSGVKNFIESLYDMFMRLLHALYVLILKIL